MNNEISSPTKINIRSTVAAAIPRKNVRNSVKSFDSKFFISPVKAKKHLIDDSDIALKEDTLISYESYNTPPLLKNNVFERILEECASNFSVVGGKQMVEEVESKILIDNDDTLLLKYIKQHYPVTLRMSYKPTYFCKENN